MVNLLIALFYLNGRQIQKNKVIKNVYNKKF